MTAPGDERKKAVIKVGDGRGFLARPSDEGETLIITAAHCLPFFPPCLSFSGPEERFYPSLLGRLGSNASVGARCRFVDPIGDIAILGRPDDQFFSTQELNVYDGLVDEVAPFSVSDAPLDGTAWMLSLDGHWFRCKIKRVFAWGPIWTSEAENIVGGMSGSPIVADDGSAIGIVCTGDGSEDSSQDDEKSTEGGPDPVLSLNLPGWFWIDRFLQGPLS
jgi:hypothetical protein